MGKRKDPASEVVRFFETASLETAVTVLGICKDMVSRRQPRAAATRKTRTSRAAASDAQGEQG